MNSNSASNKGFMLVEVLVAVVLVAIGIITLIGGLGSITSSYRRTVERETLHRLAHEKFDELIATGDWEFVFEGEFEDDRFADYEWESETTQTEVADLEYFRVTVYINTDAIDSDAFAEGLVYRPATTFIDGGAP